jgi:Ca-activated chloride channel homolog
MSRHSAIWMCVAALILAAPPVWASLQDDSQPAFTIHSDVRLVLLDVAVKDRSGALVPNLSKDNFTVLEDGKPQPITVFAHEDLPVTIGILVDESRSMTPKRQDVLMAAQTFIAESNPKDEVFVLNFNDKVSRGLPDSMLFSDDLEQLRTALDRGVPRGKTALNDAVAAGLKQLELGRRDKKALIVISDGGDNASKITRPDVLAMVEKSLATIYAVGLYDPEDQEHDLGLLKQLTRISGGEAFFPMEPEKTIPICRSIAKEIRTRYTIGYLPPAAAQPGMARHIRVQVSVPGAGNLVVKTRSGYRTDDGPEASGK